MYIQILETFIVDFRLARPTYFTFESVQYNVKFEKLFEKL